MITVHLTGQDGENRWGYTESQFGKDTFDYDNREDWDTLINNPAVVAVIDERN